VLRVASAIIMAPIALAAVYGGHWWLSALAFVVGAIGTYEWHTMSGVKTSLLVVVGALALVASLSAYQLGYELESVIIIIIGAGLGGGLSKLRGLSFIWPSWGQVYIGLAVLSVVWFQDVYGWEAVIWLLTIIWAMDIGAYFAGSLIGGPKLAPRISPKKTWAGLIGGASTACLVSWLVSDALVVTTELFAVLAGLGLALWSQIGDLIESMIKRHFDVKDSGAIIPGHGGVLDRIDSLLFTLPLLVIGLWLRPDLLFR
jgi:phosphatidate cytidylyltransferase